MFFLKGLLLEKQLDEERSDLRTAGGKKTHPFCSVGAFDSPGFSLRAIFHVVLVFFFLDFMAYERNPPQKNSAGAVFHEHPPKKLIEIQLGSG